MNQYDKARHDAAVALARLAKGVPKQLSDGERQRRRAAMTAINQRKAIERARKCIDKTEREEQKEG